MGEAVGGGGVLPELVHLQSFPNVQGRGWRWDVVRLEGKGSLPS